MAIQLNTLKPEQDDKPSPMNIDEKHCISIKIYILRFVNANGPNDDTSPLFQINGSRR